MLHILMPMLPTHLPLASSAGISVSLSEKLSSETKSSSQSDGFSSFSESITTTRSQWTVDLNLAFSSEDWAALMKTGTLQITVGQNVISEHLVDSELDRSKKKYTFKLTKEAVQGQGFRYIRLPSDPPAPTPAPKGTRVVFGDGVVSFDGDHLKISLKSNGNAASPLVGDAYTGVPDGEFVARTQVHVQAGTKKVDTDLDLSGKLERRGQTREGDLFKPNTGQTMVKIDLKGRS